jgi:DNA polymerase-3 subunit alpha
MMKHPIMGFEHLHRHSEFSLLDGFARVSEYAERMKEVNQQYLCITDHGVMGSIPQQIAECDTHKLFPLFGCELYINPMQPKVANREESAEHRKSLGDGTKTATPEQKKFDKSSHLLAIAYNNVGYANLVRLSSWAWIHGYYRRPRINHEVLMQYKEGIIFTSTCGNSEIANAFMGKDNGGENGFNEAAGFDMIEKYMAMFGEHFYLELMMLDWKMQKPYDAFLIRAHEKYHIPLILSQDCHYCKKEHSHNQRLMLMQQNKRTLAEVDALIASGEADDLFELQDTNLWMKSEEELDQKWESDYHSIIDYELYKQAKANTVKICQFAKGVKLDREVKLPKIPDAEAVLWEEVLRGFKKRNCPKDPRYIRQIREEYELIVEKGFASYFLIQKMMTDEARRVGPEIMGFGDGTEAVGPGRGSVCGSLLAYCLRLHDLDPIRHGLRFSRFLSPARGGKQTKFRHSSEPMPLAHEPIAA